LPELSAARLLEFKRTNAQNHFGTVKESRADLSEPIRFNAALLLGDPESLTRLPWKNDRQAATAATPMNPSLWDGRPGARHGGDEMTDCSFISSAPGDTGALI